jgi:hypothetical protein
MHPEGLPVGKGLLDFTIEFSEPLAEAGLPIAAAPHSPEIIRRCQHEKDRKEYVVNGAHSEFPLHSARIFIGQLGLMRKEKLQRFLQHLPKMPLIFTRGHERRRNPFLIVA